MYDSWYARRSYLLVAPFISGWSLYCGRSTRLYPLYTGRGIIRNRRWGWNEDYDSGYCSVFFTASGNQSMLLRVSVVPMLPLPINAALIFSETDGNPASLVKITNLSFSDDNKTLILQIKPLEFYEGEMLKAYAKDAIPVNSLERELKNKNTALYLELVSNLPENWKAGDENCFTECLCSSTLIAQSPYNPVTMEMAAWCKALCRTKDEIYYNECWNTPGCSGAK